MTTDQHMLHHKALNILNKEMRTLIDREEYETLACTAATADGIQGAMHSGTDTWYDVVAEICKSTERINS